MGHSLSPEDYLTKTNSEPSKEMNHIRLPVMKQDRIPAQERWKHDIMISESILDCNTALQAANLGISNGYLRHVVNIYRLWMIAKWKVLFVQHNPLRRSTRYSMITWSANWTKALLFWIIYSSVWKIHRLRV